MSNWSGEIATAYGAGMNGEPCPNAFVAAWRQGVMHSAAKRGDTACVELPLSAWDVIDAALAEYVSEWECEIAAESDIYTDADMESLRERIAQAKAAQDMVTSALSKAHNGEANR